MTDSRLTVEGPLSAREIRRMVATVWPDWDLVAADGSASGTDAVYFLTVASDDTRRDVVLKACHREDPETFRPEPYLLDAVRRETAIPVPAVYGAVDAHADLPSPFFLMERCPGEPLPRGDARLDGAALDRIARDAGRYLGELHGLGSFARFGPLRLARDLGDDGNGPITELESESGPGPEPGPEPDRISEPGPQPGSTGGIPGPGYEVTVGRDAHDEWRDWFGTLTDELLADLPDRFADLEPEIRRRLGDASGLLDGQFEPALAHPGYRLRDLLVDPESGETLAVLGFGGAYTADAEYNLAETEHHLCGWAGLDADRRERVRANLLDGYRETNALRDDGALWDLYDLYLLATWLRGLRWFDSWHADASEADRRTAAETLRDVARQLTR